MEQLLEAVYSKRLTLSSTDIFPMLIKKPQRLLIHSELCETKGGMNLTDNCHQYALDYILKDP